MQKNNFAVSLVFMLYDMQHLKKREENKNLVYKLEQLWSCKLAGYYTYQTGSERFWEYVSAPTTI